MRMTSPSRSEGQDKASPTATTFPMPATGHPVIHAFEAVFDLSGGEERITALTVICRHCSETRSASEDNLVQLPGGALFRCDGCGSHQAVSHARVADWQVNSLLGV